VTGDLIILPRGQGHTIRDLKTSPVLWLDRILDENPPRDGHLLHGGGGERSELLCGGFAIDQLAARPVLEALPAVVHLRGHEGRAPEWLSGLIRMIAVEMAAGERGGEAVVSRLSDALLAQALRQSLLEVEKTAGGASAISDRQVARALRLLRERPDQRWSVPKLASAVGMSRSGFAERFRAATGDAPIQWLTRFRLARAAEYLRTTDAGIREIARLTGYDSEVSISKAFRRHFGIPPGAYRKAKVLAQARSHRAPQHSPSVQHPR
jgi:AraC-like DNA-binding protein